MLIRILKRFTRTSVAITLIGAGLNSASAAPIVTYTLEGSTDGVNYSSVLPVRTTDTSVSYRLVADMAPIGTTNNNISGADKTITDYPGNYGLQSTKLDIAQLGSPDIAVNFTAPGTLAVEWAAGTGNSGGTVTDAGKTLQNVRPIRTAGNFSAVDPTPILTGSFGVSTSGAGSDSLVSIRFGTSSPSGSAKLRTNASDKTVIISTTSENGADPYQGYIPLTMYQPFATADAGAAYSIIEGDDLMLAGLGGKSVHTTFSNIGWDLDNDGQFDDFSSLDGTVSWSALAGLGLTPQSSPYSIGLQVLTADGELAFSATSLTIQAVPEPAAFALACTGMIGIVAARRRRKRVSAN